MSTRRTKRRYAHELYPHAEEWETRPLAVEVPYLYARAVGLEVMGTGWSDMRGDALKETNARVMDLIAASRLALLADALLQGLTGDEAWQWADVRHWADAVGDFVFERAVHYGVPVDRIKPYPCGPEPDHHDHYVNGSRRVNRVTGKESECPDCTEDTPENAEAVTT